MAKPKRKAVDTVTKKEFADLQEFVDKIDSRQGTFALNTDLENLKV